MNKAYREEKVPLTYPSTTASLLVTLGLVLTTGCLRDDPAPPAPTGASTGAQLAAPSPALPTDTKPSEQPDTQVEEQNPQPESRILSELPKTPRGGPDWLKIKAEIYEREGQRFLRTTQFVKNIKNRSLAQQAAVNRARHELTKWLGTPTLHSVTTTAHHWNAKYSLSAAQVEVALPDSWTLPKALPKER